MDALLTQLGLDDSGAPAPAAAPAAASPAPAATPASDGGSANVDETDVDSLMAQLGINAAPAAAPAATTAAPEASKSGKRELPPGACTGPADLRQRRAKAAGPAGK